MHNIFQKGISKPTLDEIIRQHDLHYGDSTKLDAAIELAENVEKRDPNDAYTKEEFEATESHFGSPWIKDNNFPSDIYIDMTSTRLSILWLIAGILNIVILVIIVALKIKSWNNKYGSSSTGVGLVTVMLISMLVAGILLIYLFMRR